MSDAVVEIRGVSKIYRQGELQVRALHNVSLTVTRGEFLSLSGPSGSGKTTLLNLIGGLDHPSEGTIHLADRRIDDLSSGELAELRLNQLGFIFQSYNLIPVLSARENVEFVMQLQGVKASERRDRALAILDEVGLSGMAERRPGELSGGQQQRVAVARAIVTNPSVVLADEPTANLDSKTATRLLELMREMNREHNVTFVFSTHDKLVMDFAERLVRLQDGEIVKAD